MTARFAPAAKTSGRLCELDSADAKNRNVHLLVNAPNLVDADGWVIGLRRSREERTEADVIRAFRRGGDRLGQAVGRLPDPAISPNDLARGGDRESSWPRCSPSDRNIAGDLRMIVDDQRDAGGAR